MDDLINMMVSDESPSDISDKIKEILMAKASERIELKKPEVAASIVSPQTEVEPDSEDSEDSEAPAEEEPETSEEESE